VLARALGTKRGKPSPFTALPELKPAPPPTPTVEETRERLRREFNDAKKAMSPIAPEVRIVHPHWARWPRADDDPRMIGDYPAGPTESYQLRDPRDPRWEDPQTRRAAGEDVPEDWEALGVWAPDIPPQRWGWPWLVAGPLVFVAMLGAMCGVGLLIPMDLPAYALRDLPYSAKYYPGGVIPDDVRA
jgi:hypothetical protein